MTDDRAGIDSMTCPLCSPDDEAVVWKDDSCRVISVSDPDYAGYCRVIWNAHVVEMTDLSQGEQRRLLDVVLATETTLRCLMKPDKINLASFGNLVPHLHWHVIPRFGDDRHFPDPVWGRPQRTGVRRESPSADAIAAGIATALAVRDPPIGDAQERLEE